MMTLDPTRNGPAEMAKFPIAVCLPLGYNSDMSGRERKRLPLTSEDLAALYLVEGLSQNEIATRFGVCQMTVSNALVRFGIKARAIGRKAEATADLLRALYDDQGLSQQQIGDKLGVSQSVVGDYLKSFGIETRGVGSKREFVIPEEELRDLYRVQHWTLARIAKHFGCAKTTIQQNVVRYGMRMTKREKKEARRTRNDAQCGYITTEHGYLKRMAREHPAAGGGGYVMEHRLVGEAAIGRYLVEGEIVHHISMRVQDNRIENLAVLPSNRAHMLTHHYMSRVAAYLCGLTEIRPEALDFGAPVFWGGRYVTSIDLIPPGAQAFGQPALGETTSQGMTIKEVVN